MLLLAVIAVRFLWVFPATYGPRWVSRRLREREPAERERDLAAHAGIGVRDHGRQQGHGDG